MTSSATEEAGGYIAKITRGAPESFPIARCPDDVLMSIFEAASNAGEEKTKDDFVDKKLAVEVIARTLSQVCKRWRDISLKIPHLWRNITISCRKPLETVLSFLVHMHGRVKNIPINLLISELGYSDMNPPKVLHLLQLGLYRFPHIRFLRIAIWQHARQELDYEALLRAFRGCKIDELEIRPFRFGSEPPVTVNTSLLMKSLPTITALSLSRVYHAHFIPEELLESIKELSLSEMTFCFMTVLQCFPGLEELRVTLATITDKQQIPKPPLVMDKLRVLRLHSISQKVDYMLEYCFKQISFPVLARLQFFHAPMENRWEFIALNPSIIQIDSIFESSIHHLIEKSPQLESLQLLYHIRYEELWDTAIDHPPLPKLKQLSIDNLHTRNIRSRPV